MTTTDHEATTAADAEAIAVAGRSFLVALPDAESVGPIARRLEAVSRTTVRHPSGRVWLAGRLTSGRLVTASDRRRSVAVVGESDATQETLAAILDTASTADAVLDAVRRRVAGSHHVVVSDDGTVVARGAALQTRRWFASRSAGGAWLLADRADVLAELVDAPLDEVSVAMRLAGAWPHPLHDTVLWTGVEAVPGPEQVRISQDGRRRECSTWWSMPAPDLDRAQGADALRRATEAAVGARVVPGRRVACDLSGGLDSTSLCFFAAQGPDGVLARTLHNDDPGGGEDLRWARIALEAMPGVHTHLVGSTDDLDDFYGGVTEVDALLDEPTQAATAAPRIVALLRDDVARTIGVHLNGLGGDHLLRGVDAWEHTLARTRPLQAWRRARSAHIPAGIGPLTTLRQLTDRRPYADWLADVVDRGLRGAPAPELPGINDWTTGPTLAPWLTAQAREAVRERAIALCQDAQPLDPTMAGHSDLFHVQDAARLVRGTAQLGHPWGVGYEAPLLDDRVVEAAFATRREERDTPLEWKPLMKAAMTGLLPAAYLARTNKVGGGPQSVRGYARHHDRLIGLVEASGLFADGLVDRDALLRTTAPRSRETPPGHVHPAINVAVFLRNWRGRSGAFAPVAA